MAKLLIIGIVLAVVFWVVSIVDCAVQPTTRHRGVSKGTWIAIVIVVPVIGGILWFWIGRHRATQVRYSAPDDDAAFLSSLRAAGLSAAEQDERIRQLEEELARLDAEEAQNAGGAAAEQTTAEPPTEPSNERGETPDDDTDPKHRPDGDDSRDQHGARG